MKTAKFSSNFRYVLFDFICAAALLLVCVVIVLLQVISKRFNWIFTAAGGVTFVFMLLELFSFLTSWQTVCIEDEKIISKCVFGVVEAVNIPDVQITCIKKIAVAKIFGHRIRRKFIIVSTNAEQGKIEGCYAEEECGYIVIPNTKENRKMLKQFLTIEQPEQSEKAEQPAPSETEEKATV